MQQRQRELVQPIMKQIREVLDEMRAGGGTRFIFDVGATTNVVVAADKILDITEKVIASPEARSGDGVEGRFDQGTACGGRSRSQPESRGKPPTD